MGKVLGTPIRSESVFLDFSLAYTEMSTMLAINCTPEGEECYAMMNALACFKCLNAMYA